MSLKSQSWYFQPICKQWTCTASTAGPSSVRFEVNSSFDIEFNRHPWWKVAWYCSLVSAATCVQNLGWYSPEHPSSPVLSLHISSKIFECYIYYSLDHCGSVQLAGKHINVTNLIFFYDLLAMRKITFSLINNENNMLKM